MKIPHRNPRRSRNPEETTWKTDDPDTDAEGISITITTTTTASLTTIERAKGSDDLSGIALAKPEPLLVFSREIVKNTRPGQIHSLDQESRAYPPPSAGITGETP
ncbi:MAG: hypothetical protein R6U13_09490 [Desulfatiglandaceae bacterium]